jgi:NADH:ubiquinone oxidoreductase subunit 6 (subunit J)
LGAGRSTKEEFVASIIVVAFVIAVFVFMATVEMMHCPKCENHESEKYSCTYCGGDGKVTLLQYLAIVLTQGYSIVELDRICGLPLSAKKSLL